MIVRQVREPREIPQELSFPGNNQIVTKRELESRCPSFYCITLCCTKLTFLQEFFQQHYVYSSITHTLHRKILFRSPVSRSSRILPFRLQTRVSNANGSRARKHKMGEIRFYAHREWLGGGGCSFSEPAAHTPHNGIHNQFKKYL